MGQTQKYGLRYPENDGYVRETASYIKNLAEDVENKMPQGGSGGGDTLPIGAILPFSSDTIPNGWLLCDGSIVEQAEYPELFEVIGTTYGHYSKTDFKLPDLRRQSGSRKKYCSRHRKSRYRFQRIR